MALQYHQKLLPNNQGSMLKFVLILFCLNDIITGGPRLIRFLGPGKNRDMRNFVKIRNWEFVKACAQMSLIFLVILSIK